MAYLFDVLPFPYGCRMTDLWKGPWVDDPHDREIAMGHLVKLPDGQLADVESDFLASHLPFHAGGFGGVYADGNAWLFVVQQGPPDASDVLAHGSDPFQVMRDSLDRALSFNPGAAPVFEVRVDQRRPRRGVRLAGDPDRPRSRLAGRRPAERSAGGVLRRPSGRHRGWLPGRLRLPRYRARLRSRRLP